MCTREFVAALCSGLFAVLQANALADRLYEPLSVLLVPLLSWLNTLPTSTVGVLAGDYGVVAMLPFLLLYAADGTRLHCAN